MTTLAPKTITMVGYARCMGAVGAPTDAVASGTGGISTTPTAKFAYPPAPTQVGTTTEATDSDVLSLAPEVSEVGIDDAPPDFDSGLANDAPEDPLPDVATDPNATDDSNDNIAILPTVVTEYVPAAYVVPIQPVRGGALVELVERTADGDQPSNYLNLLAQDVSSMAYQAPDLEGSLYPLQIPDTGTAYSYERWFRFRFTPPFNAVQMFRFFCPNYQAVDGWTVLWGTASVYSTAVNTPSTVAVNPLPTTDPLVANCGGSSALDGSQVRYTDWIVLQASVDSTALAGPFQGYGGDNRPSRLDYDFRWLEL